MFEFFNSVMSSPFMQYSMAAVIGGYVVVKLYGKFFGGPKA